LVRRHDPDRFLTALFAPPGKRETLLTLYAFNHELARAREVASEPMIALMRLQWWREVVEGAPRRHDVATPLSAALDSGALSTAELLALIDAREIECEPVIETLVDWRNYLLGTAGGLMVAAGRLLGVQRPESLRPLGAAYGAAGVLRSVPSLARQRRCMLPADVLTEHGISPYSVIAEPRTDAVHAAMRQLARSGQEFLSKTDRRLAVPRQSIAALLPAVLARRDLRRLPTIRPRGIGDRLAVVTAWLTRRL
jgi:phytoene synthase